MPYKFNPFTANLDFVPESSTLDGLSDVAVPDPQEGDVLAYNSSTSLWEKGFLFGAADLIVAFFSNFGKLHFNYIQNSSHIATVL
jgi:hypothetical protein